MNDAELTSLREWAAALERSLAGGFVQEVRIAGPELIGLAIRRPGTSAILGLSVLAAAPGALLLGELPQQPRADGLLTGMRDLLRARVVGCRVESVRACALEHPMLRLDFTRRDEALSVLLDLGGRGNLEVHDAGHAPQALRPPAGDLPTTHPALACAEAASDAAARERADVETSRLHRLRARLLHERTLAELRQRLRRACKGALTLVERREADGARLGDPSDLRVEADALAAHLHVIRRGQSCLEVPDWNGRPLVLELDPAVPAAATLKRYYARAAKAERGVLEAGRRLTEARERARALDALKERATDPALEWPATIHGSVAAASQGLAQLEADAALLLRPERAPQDGSSSSSSSSSGGRTRSGKPAADSSLKPREYLSKDGLRILVGRSAKGNHALTFRIARGNDIWLHARGCPGAHVVLVMPKGGELPSDSLVDAATLAHAHSKLSKEPRGEILWCHAKEVHTRRGMKPGEVTTTREKVLPLRVEPERLARLEASEKQR